MTFELPCVPILRKSCCCGCSVRSGAIFLGWLGLFAFVAQFVCVALVILNFEEFGVPHQYHGGEAILHAAILDVHIVPLRVQPDCDFIFRYLNSGT
ncbi:hypothetical protein C0J52_17760 [Blattella germanica]|nr:hypothetical protein C0J52_17760 [Blattella germanica]